MESYSKRAQIQSQHLIYIFALVIVVLILILGYKTTSGYQRKTDQISQIQFEQKLRNDVESLSSDYGSVKVKEYQLPPGFDEICFVDLEKVDTENIFNYPLIKDSVKSGVKANVFLLRENDNKFEESYIEGLKLQNFPYYSCVKSKKAELTIQGLGDGAVVKAPPNEKYCKNAQDDNLCNLLDSVLGSGYKAECCTKYSLCC